MDQAGRTQHKDVLSCDLKKREARGEEVFAPSGRPFLSSTSFGRAKEMDPGVQGRSARVFLYDRGQRPHD
jgi:hypothetical protein